MGGIARELGRLAGRDCRPGRSHRPWSHADHTQHMTAVLVDIWYASHLHTILVPGTLININCEKCSLYENYGCNLVRVNPLCRFLLADSRLARSKHFVRWRASCMLFGDPLRDRL
jgi:hypothetical protein